MRRLILIVLLVCNAALWSQTSVITGDSTINQCETKTYTVTIQNNSGSPLTDIVVTVRLGNLPGFSYLAGTAGIDVGGLPICNGGGDNAEPVVSGTDLIWTIDSRCPSNSPFTLANGQTLNVTFDLSTDCTSVSGSLNVRIDYEISGTPTFDETGALGILVLPGGLTIKKTPNIIPQILGQDVTWTLTVENSGYGTVKNVIVTDLLGAGMAYVSSIPSGVNSGQTTTWGAAEIPALAAMNPGEIVTIDITATVIACQNLENSADARWGCDQMTDCYNTADTIPPATATASVQRQPRTPLLDYTPPDVSFTYCDDDVDVSFPISNLGDGTAYTVWLRVDPSPFTVSDVSAGATYNASERRFEINDPIAAGGSYTLGFRLSFSTWCGGAFPAGPLLWQTVYQDECHQEFYPPVKISNINPPGDTPTLTMAKTGGGGAIQIGDQVVYAITSAYNGLLSCGSGTTGSVTVVDTLPSGFTVLDDGGGTWVPGAGGTGGTVTWTYTPPASLATSITLQSPDRTQCEAYCFTTFTNSATASVVDCCGCMLNASASQTSAIECEELVDSEKTAVPTVGIRCSDIQYANTYAFADNAALDGVDLSQLIFNENADNEQEYVPGSLQVTLSGAGDITACAQSGMTDTTPGAGGTLSINFANCTTYGSIRNRTLTISYQLQITEATTTACAGTSFYSWSSLDTGLTTGSECLADGIINEVTTVTVEAPAMGVDIAGLGQVVDKCQTHTITLTLSQASAVADPKDVRLVLSGLNYYVVNPAATACSGSVAPTSCVPTLVGDDYVWYFGDGFTGSGQDAVIQLEVRKRCTGSGDLQATAYFDDNCNDDGTYDDSCSASAVETPLMLRSGDLLIEKTPEVYYATTNTVAWKVYVTNRGNGTAYFTWVDDILGSGLDYQSAVVDDMTGVTVTADLDHAGSPVNGCTIAISDLTPGERREITLTALVVNCTNLTNDVAASWGCAGSDCQVPVSDGSTVMVPQPLLINTNTVVTPVEACSQPTGYITLRNAGQTTCYNLQLTETLTTGLEYISGTTRWRLNGGGWNGPNAAYDPSPTTSPLHWTSTQISGLAEVHPGDTLEIEYDLRAQCPFSGGNITLSTSYENPCGQVFTNADSVFTVALRAPQVTVTKTRANEPIDCGQLVEWTITVQNTSGYTLPIIWVEDTLDAAFTYSSSVGDPPFTSDNGTFDGINTVSWELRDVNHNDTVTLTLRATSDSSPCSPNLDNTVLAWWGCGAADGSSATKPGEDPPDNALCLTSTAVSTVRTETRRPSVGFLNIVVNPLSLNSCDDSTELTVTITNSGPTDASNVDLVITLPAGLTYIANSAAVSCGGVMTDPAPDPVISGNQLIFYNTSNTANNLCNLIQAAGGNDTVTLVFSVHSSCYSTANLGFNLYFYDCCGDTQYNIPASQSITALYPQLAVTKTPASAQVACGDNQTWTITVTNTGTGDAQVVRIEDTLGDWIDYVSSSPAATSLGGQVYGWEVNNLAAGGGSQSFTITGQLNPDAPQADCAALLRQNNARAIWGCGTTGDAVDGDPGTTDYDCTNSTWNNAPAAILRLPDLVATAITPIISCTSDGTFSGSISATVRNQGDGIAYGPFTVEVTDGAGWTGTGSHAGNLASGAEATVTIDVSSWNPDCTPCSYGFSATVDSGSTVCECREDNNSFGPQAYSPAIPNLQVDTDTLAITCVTDGQYRVSGTVTLRNAGCSGTLNQDVPMRFTLISGAGCTGTPVAQWTETFSGVNIAAGSTQAFTITNYTIVGDACTSASGCQFSILSEADYTNAVCECDGGDNTRCSDKTFTIPDLRVVSDTLAISCSVDGQIRIQGNLVVANDGCGANLATNLPIRIRVYNNNAACAGVNGSLLFNQAGVNIPAGGTQTFAINRTMNRNLCTNSTGCQVAIGVELDYSNVICECSNANNNYCSPNKVVSIPDLQVTGDALSVACLQDGQVRVSGTATIANTGCNAAVVGNLPARFTLFSNINCGGVQIAQWTETFAGVNIAAGGSQVFTITNRDLITNICTNSTGCQVSLRIEADPGAVICECNGGNNTRCSNKTVSIPDLRITAVTPSITCASDGSLNGTVQVTVNNNGCGSASNVPVRLTSDCGYTFTDQTVASLAVGASTTLTFSFTPDSARCTCTFTAAVDPDNVVCECDGTNNTLASAPYTSPVPDLTITDIDFSNVTCANDNISGSVNVTVNNQGCGAANNIPVSLTTDGCLSFSNQTIVSLAAGASTTVTFTISGSWADCTDGSCQFTAAVDPGNTVCEYDGTNNSRSETFNSTLPDLVVSDIDFGTISCTGDNISGSVNVTIQNQGFGNAANFQVSLASDGCLSFGNQVVANLAAGASTTVTFTVSGSWADCTDCTCSLLATVDPSNVVCECNGANNTRSEDYTQTLPDLRVNSVAPAVTCLGDGNLAGSATVNVANIGCGAANNAVVRLTSSCGYVLADQTVNLAAGANANLTFSFTPTCLNCSCTFTAVIDPDDAICECRGDNNSMTSGVFNMDIPDVTVEADALAIACAADGQATVSGSVTLGNRGCGSNLTADVPVRFTLFDDSGCSGNIISQWTETLTGVNIAAGGGSQSLAVTAHNIAANLVANSTDCRISLRIEADFNDSICECDGTNNAYCTADKNVNIPDLQVTSDTLAVSCLMDGQVTFSGNVTLTNSGCGSNLTADVPMRFTLYDNTGCNGNIISQWTEAFTGVNIASSGGTQAFTIAPTTIVGNLVDNSTGCQVSLRVEADYSNAICEADGSNNTRCADDQAVDIPDIEVVSDTLAVTCVNEGQARISGTVTLANTGCGSNLTADVPMRFTIFDNAGCSGNIISQWTEAFAGVNIASSGGTQSFVITAQDLTSNLCTLSTACQVSIRIEADYPNSICESDGGNNLLCSDKTPAIPNLTIDTVASTIVCESDGVITGTTVTVSNTGCAPAAAVIVRLTSDCGLTFADQTVDLAAGETRDLFFAFTSGITNCICTFTAVIDPDNTVCECDGSDNTGTSTLNMAIPDIVIQSQSLEAVCSHDGEITVSGSLTLINSGCGPALTSNLGMRFTLYGQGGCGGTVLTQWTQVLTGVNVPSSGGTQTLTVQPYVLTADVCDVSPDCQLSVRAEADYDLRICEWSGTNNDACTTLPLACLDLSFSDLTWTCAPDGSVTFALQVHNAGNRAAENVEIRAYDASSSLIFSRTVSIPAGGTADVTFTTPPFPLLTDNLFRFVIDENDLICECDATNNVRTVTVNCPALGKPLLEVEKSCPRAQLPGAPFLFEIVFWNRGDGGAGNVEIRDFLPEPFQYVPGSSLLDGQPFSDPQGAPTLVWKLAEMKKGSRHILSFLAIAPADTDPGTYCNEIELSAQAPDRSAVTSNRARCCTILRQDNTGCCILIEEWPLGSFLRPEAPISFVEPYFRTRDGMFSAYAALHFQSHTQPPSGTTARFIADRLRNYALSTVEEFYFRSGMGIYAKRGAPVFAYNGAYPRIVKDQWETKPSDRFMTPAQLAFELLGLQAAAKHEENPQLSQKLLDLFQKKMEFLAAEPRSLPEKWQFEDNRVRAGKDPATLEDQASIFFALQALKKEGATVPQPLLDEARRQLQPLHNSSFDEKKPREELLYMLGLLEAGDVAALDQKLDALKKYLDREGDAFDRIEPYALAAVIDSRRKGGLQEMLRSEMDRKFYQAQAGVYAVPCADLTYRISLSDMAPLMLALETGRVDEGPSAHEVLYRMLDQAGLFLNQKNLMVEAPPLNLVRNQALSSLDEPILSLVKSQSPIAPVFTEQALFHVPSAPLPQDEIFPYRFSHFLAPSYETATGRVARLSAHLQFQGRQLQQSPVRIVREQGRSLEASGSAYLDVVFAAASGLHVDGMMVLPTETLAAKALYKESRSLEALQHRYEFHTSTLAALLVAEKLYVQGEGKEKERMRAILSRQQRILAALKKRGPLPATFSAFLENDGQEPQIAAASGQADPLTLDKLAFALDDPQWKSPSGTASQPLLRSEDLAFLLFSQANPAPYLSEIENWSRSRQAGKKNESSLAQSSGEILANRLLKRDPGKSLPGLLQLWDRETSFPGTNRQEKSEFGSVIQYGPEEILLFLQALPESEAFKFQRTLSLITSLVESEWGMENSQLYRTLPASAYWLIRNRPRETLEPGDTLLMKVRVENRCPDGAPSGRDLPSLFIDAGFQPPLLHTGTLAVEGLENLSPLLWKYSSLFQGNVLEYLYQVQIPRDFRDNFLEGNIHVRGYTGYQDFGPESASGDYCEDDGQARRLPFQPLQRVEGVVFEDLNANGIQEPGERGIPQIRLKESTGRLPATDTEGKFLIWAGDEMIGIQIDLRSVPPEFVLTTPATQLVNRGFRGRVVFGLVPCITHSGAVYHDRNGNGIRDGEEPAVAGVMVRSQSKEAVSLESGRFTLFNLPRAWKKEVVIAEKQPFCQIPREQLRIEDTR